MSRLLLDLRHIFMPGNILFFIFLICFIRIFINIFICIWFSNISQKLWPIDHLYSFFPQSYSKFYIFQMFLHLGLSSFVTIFRQPLIIFLMTSLSRLIDSTISHLLFSIFSGKYKLVLGIGLEARRYRANKTIQWLNENRRK